MSLADIKELSATGALIFVAVFMVVRLSGVLSQLAVALGKVEAVISKCDRK